MPEAVGAQCRQMHAVARLTPMLRRCCGGRLLLRGGTRHIRVVDPEQGGFVTPRRVESRTSEDAMRAKDQDNVRAIVSDSGLSSNADVAAIFCDDPRHIVSDGHAPGNQLDDARGILLLRPRYGACSESCQLGLILP